MLTLIKCRGIDIYEDYTRNETFGKLKNFGKDLAFDIQVQWIVNGARSYRPIRGIEFKFNELVGANALIELKPTHLADNENRIFAESGTFDLLIMGLS